MKNFCKLLLCSHRWSFKKLCPEWPLLKYYAEYPFSYDRYLLLRKPPKIEHNWLVVEGNTIDIDEKNREYKMNGGAINFTSIIPYDKCIFFSCMDFKLFTHMVELQEFADKISRYVENFDNMFEIERLAGI